MTRGQLAARRVVLGLLRRLPTGTLTITERDGRRHVLGGGGEPTAQIQVLDERGWPILLRGSLGLAQTYQAGYWDSPDVVAVIRFAARNIQQWDRYKQRLATVRRPYQKLTGVRRAVTRDGAREDIHAHYDVGNDFFERMLDETMMYSAGVFADPETPLREASVAKLELLCDKLALGPEDHVLEIGTGWGGFALHAATTRGCRVTTTTISKEQRALALQRIADSGLSDRVTVLEQDYRDLTGQYRHLVSVEMIEAVGWRDFPTFFAKCSDLLAPDGAMLLQAITMDDRAYEVEKASKSFIRSLIFPNGCLPSQEVIARCLRAETDLRMVHHEDLSADYVLTLQRWRENFDAAAAELDGLGYDERFRRLWRMYLCYVEAGFAERRIGVGQTLLVKPDWRAPVPATAKVSRVIGGLEDAAAAHPAERRRGVGGPLSS